MIKLTNIYTLLAIGLAIRLALVAYAEWQDARCESPYERLTYRYTPLLYAYCDLMMVKNRAWILTPNIVLAPYFGKVLFCVSDILIGYMLYKILLSAYKMKSSTAAKYVACWIFNPLSINVSSRGNAESLISLLVILCIHELYHGRYFLSGLAYGASVHFKVYPILYSLPLLLYLLSLNKNRWSSLLKFAAGGAISFVALTGIGYYYYGMDFIHEAYLYHVGRKDNRHNFSVYFLYLYLSFTSPSSLVAALFAFLPQMLVCVAFGIKYFKELPFAFFLQTIAFVAFNKVCTVQYFIWYTVFLPLILPKCTWSSPIRALCSVGAFAVTLGLWLKEAYALEFLGDNTFLSIWQYGMAFFAANLWMTAEFMFAYK